MMGSSEQDREKPLHKVTLLDFYMGRYAVTNEEYGRFIEATGYQKPLYWDDGKFNQLRQPVVGVSWHDARAFAQWAGLELPSEAQWEYACRGGTRTKYSWGDEPDCTKANYGNSSNSQQCKDINPGKTSAVGNYPPNAFGLYDMHGNVWEWCEDHWHENYEGAPDDGSAWVDGDNSAYRVMRGGSWYNDAVGCRSAIRVALPPGARIINRGFRLVRLSGWPAQ